MKKSSLFYDIFESPVGTLYLIFSGEFLVRISFKKPSRIAFRKNSAPENFIKELNNYFHGGDSSFSQKIKFLNATEFDKKVCNCLTEIPFGETRTYKWVAERIGNPKAVRAVGKALSRNPLLIVLPCHRVIESDGSIGGYSSGVNIKRRLLEMEYYAKIIKSKD
ncbi:MAG: methylated-DNA--[protein]-cysteine S-methyltransferase [Nitrospirae bacterium]|nr:methylated-DNA--[protein]-cysteine S-methyltransferase [Nitrospirota bacterium]